MGGTLETTPHRLGLGQQGTEQCQVVHETQPVAGFRTFQDLKEFLAEPLGSYLRHQGSLLTDSLDRGSVDDKVELSGQPDRPQEAQRVFHQQIGVPHPDSPLCQVSQTSGRIDQPGRLLPKRHGHCVDREVPALQVFDDSPPPDRSNVHLYPLFTPTEDNTPHVVGEADHFSSELLLQSRTERKRIDGNEVDVESPWTLKDGISQESPHEVDWQNLLLCCHDGHLPKQGMMLTGHKDARNSSAHVFTLRDGGRNVNIPSPPKTSSSPWRPSQSQPWTVPRHSDLSEPFALLRDGSIRSPTFPRVRMNPSTAWASSWRIWIPVGA